jgi:hypothetical protein
VWLALRRPGILEGQLLPALHGYMARWAGLLELIGQVLCHWKVVEWVLACCPWQPPFPQSMCRHLGAPVAMFSSRAYLFTCSFADVQADGLWGCQPQVALLNREHFEQVQHFSRCKIWVT